MLTWSAATAELSASASETRENTVVFMKRWRLVAYREGKRASLRGTSPSSME
jgi:hypothetical protein